MSDLQRFTINRDQAIAKMREYALRHPDQWVLELAQAAVFVGASQVDFVIDRDQLRVSWVGGAALSGDLLQRLFDHLFLRSTNPEERGVQQVALGVNALLQQRARRVRIRSGDGTSAGSVVATVSRSGDVAVAPDARLAGTTVSVTLRKPSLFHTLLETWEKADEGELIRQRCTFFPIPLFLNGRPLVPVHTASLHAAHLSSSTRIDDGPVRAVLGTARPHLAPEVVFVVGGVVITRKPVPELGERTAGVIRDDRLRKTADGADIVMDEAYHATIATCQAAILPVLRSAHAAVSTRAFDAPGLPSLVGTLSDPVAQVAPRPDLTHDAIDALPSDVPLFVVDPDLPLSTDAVLDPHSFPWPVLLIPPSQNAGLAERFPTRRVARLTTAEDARFLRDLRLRTHPRVISEPVRHGEVTLRIEVQTMVTAAEQATPLLHRFDGRTQTLHTLQPALPGVRVVVNAEVLPSPTHLLPALREALAQVLPELDGQPVLSPLRQAIAVAFALPHFVNRPDGPHVQLHLPRELHAVEEAVLAEPIASGPSAADLAAVMGTPRCVPAPDSSLDALWPLETRLGVGHLSTPHRDTTILLAMGAVERQWTWLDVEDGWALEGVSDVLLLCGSLTPRIAWDGWTPSPSPHPGIVHLTRAGNPAVATAAGLALLSRVFDDMAHHNAWPDAHQALLQAMSRRVQLELGSTPRALRDVVASDTLRIRPIGGLDDPDPTTVALTLDEAVALYHDADVPLRLDDPVSAWTDPGDSAVARVAIETAWGRGWLALPRPFDATLGVLWTHQGQDVPVPSLDARWPCRGHIAARVPLQPCHIAELHLMARALYAQLDPDRDDSVAAAYRKNLPRHPAAPATERHIEASLIRVLECQVAWRSDGPTQVRTDAMGTLRLRIGSPHRALLAEPATRGPGLLDLARRVARLRGDDASQLGLALTGDWWQRR